MRVDKVNTHNNLGKFLNKHKHNPKKRKNQKLSFEQILKEAVKNEQSKQH